MKDVSAFVMPDDVRYTNDHEWARKEGDLVRVGLDDYAQDQLGDIVFIGLPEVGATFAQGEEFATVDSVKASAECYMPVSGKIVEVNRALDESPQSVNQSPYKDGWFVLVKPNDLSELDSLMTSNECLDKLRGKE